MRSEPSGAKVVLIGNWMICKRMSPETLDGLTPCTFSVDSSAFDPTGRSWIDSKVLGVPLKIRLTKDGYKPVDVDLTNTDPLTWTGRDVSGRIEKKYFFIKAEKFEVLLEKDPNYQLPMSPGGFPPRPPGDPLSRVSATDAAADCKRFYEQNEPEKALAACTFGISLKADSTDPNLYHYRCLANYMLGRLEPALADCHHLTQLQPDNPVAWNNTGLILQALGRNNEALVSFTKTLQIDPKNIKALRNRASTYERLGRSEAVDDYNQAINIAPDDAESRIMRADLYNRVGDCQSAEADAMAALASVSKRAEALLQLGTAHLCEGRYSAAVDDLNGATRINPTWVLPLARICKADLQLKQFDKALAYCNEAVKRAPSAAYPLLQRAEIYVAIQRFEEASADVRHAASLAGDDASILDLDGRINEGRGNLMLALKDYDKAVQLDPNRVLSYIHRAHAKRIGSDYEGASVDLATAKRLMSDRKTPAATVSELEAEKQSLQSAQIRH